MKYCAKFYRDFRYMNEVDEIMITYKNQDANLIKFLVEIPEWQRIVVDISHNEDMKIEENLSIFYAAFRQHKNLTIKMSITQKDMCADLFEQNIPYFFDEFVDKWDVLISFIKLGVSDVYIVNELGFELKNVSKVCKENNVNIRVFPNVAQSGSKINNLDKLKTFFIRPEDIYAYEEYVDICEFFGPLDRQSVLYKIYKNERWMGNLEELIIGLNISFSNRTILPIFGEKRINCEKKCYYGQCIICEKIETVANQLKEAEIELVTKRNKDIKDEDEYEIIKEFNENEAGSTTFSFM